MPLKRHDQGEPVKELQRRLNRLGSLLLVDGDFGESTEAAVVDARVKLAIDGPADSDDALMSSLAQVPDPSPELTAPGVTFVARTEVSSPAAYRQRYHRPELPGEASGITIGIGYDLGQVSEATFRQDWGDVLLPAVVDRLAAACGKQGPHDLLARLRDVDVPLLTAVRVFLERSVPHYAGETRRIYPSLDTLSPPRRTALISLVYNRGAVLQDSQDRPGNRREMRNIRDLLAAGNLDAVAAEFESMTRLWDPAVSPGLIDRRRAEAALWRSGFEALQLA